MKSIFFTQLFLFTTILTFGQKFQKVIITTNDDSAKVFIEDYLVGKGKYMIASIRKDGESKNVVITSSKSKRKSLTIEPIKLRAFQDSFHFELESRKFRANDEKYVIIHSIQFDFINCATNPLNAAVMSTDYSDLNFTLLEEQEKEKTLRKKIKENNGLGMTEKLNKNRDQENNNSKLSEFNFNQTTFNNLKQLGYIVDTEYLFLYNYKNTLIIDVKITEFTALHYFYPSFRGNPDNIEKKVKFRSTIYLKNIYNEIIDSINGTTISNVSTSHIFDILDSRMGEVIEELLSKEFISKHSRVKKETRSNANLINIKRSQNFVKSIKDAIKSTVIVEQDNQSYGSGFAINDDGYILTNYHVVSKRLVNSKSLIYVLLPNKERLLAEIIRTDRIHDLALLKINKKFETFFHLSDERNFEEYQQVYAIGTPKSKELDNSVCIGILSNERTNDNIPTLQLNMSLNAGNSGGPLIDKEGNLHGIIVAKLHGDYTEGIGFAIPSYLCSNYLKLQFE